MLTTFSKVIIIMIILFFIYLLLPPIPDGVCLPYKENAYNSPDCALQVACEEVSSNYLMYEDIWIRMSNNIILFDVDDYPAYKDRVKNIFSFGGCYDLHTVCGVEGQSKVNIFTYDDYSLIDSIWHDHTNFTVTVHLEEYATFEFCKGLGDSSCSNLEVTGTVSSVQPREVKYDEYNFTLDYIKTKVNIEPIKNWYYPIEISSCNASDCITRFNATELKGTYDWLGLDVPATMVLHTEENKSGEIWNADSLIVVGYSQYYPQFEINNPIFLDYDIVGDEICGELENAQNSEDCQ